MTAPATEGDTWEAAALRAARSQRGLTQEQLAADANLSRTTINHLEKGRRSMTRYYADVLAPHLGIMASELLPPGSLPVTENNPLALLRALAETVGKQQVTIDGLERKVEALERGASKRRRANGAG